MKPLNLFLSVAAVAATVAGVPVAERPGINRAEAVTVNVGAPSLRNHRQQYLAVVDEEEEDASSGSQGLLPDVQTVPAAQAPIQRRSFEQVHRPAADSEPELDQTTESDSTTLPIIQLDDHQPAVRLPRRNAPTKNRRSAHSHVFKRESNQAMPAWNYEQIWPSVSRTAGTVTPGFVVNLWHSLQGKLAPYKQSTVDALASGYQKAKGFVTSSAKTGLDVSKSFAKEKAVTELEQAKGGLQKRSHGFDGYKPHLGNPDNYPVFDDPPTAEHQRVLPDDFSPANLPAGCSYAPVLDQPDEIKYNDEILNVAKDKFRGIKGLAPATSDGGSQCPSPEIPHERTRILQDARDSWPRLIGPQYRAPRKDDTHEWADELPLPKWPTRNREFEKYLNGIHKSEQKHKDLLISRLIEVQERKKKQEAAEQAKWDSYPQVKEADRDSVQTEIEEAMSTQYHELLKEGSVALESSVLDTASIGGNVHGSDIADNERLLRGSDSSSGSSFIGSDAATTHSSDLTADSISLADSDAVEHGLELPPGFAYGPELPPGFQFAAEDTDNSANAASTAEGSQEAEESFFTRNMNKFGEWLWNDHKPRASDIELGLGKEPEPGWFAKTYAKLAGKVKGALGWNNDNAGSPEVDSSTKVPPPGYIDYIKSFFVSKPSSEATESGAEIPELLPEVPESVAEATAAVPDAPPNSVNGDVDAASINSFYTSQSSADGASLHRFQTADSSASINSFLTAADAASVNSFQTAEPPKAKGYGSSILSFVTDKITGLNPFGKSSVPATPDKVATGSSSDDFMDISDDWAMLEHSDAPEEAPNGYVAGIEDDWVDVSPAMKPDWPWKFEDSARNFFDMPSGSNRRMSSGNGKDETFDAGETPGFFGSLVEGAKDAYGGVADFFSLPWSASNEPPKEPPSQPPPSTTPDHLTPLVKNALLNFVTVPTKNYGPVDKSWSPADLISSPMATVGNVVSGTVNTLQFLGGVSGKAASKNKVPGAFPLVDGPAEPPAPAHLPLDMPLSAMGEFSTRNPIVANGGSSAVDSLRKLLGKRADNSVPPAIPAPVVPADTFGDLPEAKPKPVETVAPLPLTFDNVREFDRYNPNYVDNPSILGPPTYAGGNNDDTTVWGRLKAWLKQPRKPKAPFLRPESSGGSAYEEEPENLALSGVRDGLHNLCEKNPFSPECVDFRQIEILRHLVPVEDTRAPEFQDFGPQP